MALRDGTGLCRSRKVPVFPQAFQRGPTDDAEVPLRPGKGAEERNWPCCPGASNTAGFPVGEGAGMSFRQGDGLRDGKEMNRQDRAVPEALPAAALAVGVFVVAGVAAFVEPVAGVAALGERAAALEVQGGAPISEAERSRQAVQALSHQLHEETDVCSWKPPASAVRDTGRPMVQWQENGDMLRQEHPLFSGYPNCEAGARWHGWRGTWRPRTGAEAGGVGNGVPRNIFGGEPKGPCGTSDPTAGVLPTGGEGA